MWKPIADKLFTNWNWFRWLRLGAGLAFLFYAIQRADAVAGIISAFFLIQAFANTGCCLLSFSARSNAGADSADDVQYEEVLRKK